MNYYTCREIFTNYGFTIKPKGQTPKVVDDETILEILAEKATANVGYHRMKDTLEAKQKCISDRQVKKIYTRFYLFDLKKGEKKENILQAICSGISKSDLAY